ncbi:MAG: endonuclease/exonuclease/phosphatase family protein [Deltaproteobacteria bacterium]|nr:endonuclease/exonuclease/phosphatase family protein [Deltaproteobacteria bacterium]
MIHSRTLSASQFPGFPKTPGRVLSAIFGLVLFFLFSHQADAEISLPPIECGGSCSPIVFDGEVQPLDFANGVKAPLQDFVNGSADSELFLAAEDGILYIGLRLPKTEVGELFLYFDGDRDDTLSSSSPNALAPRSEDRSLWVEYLTEDFPALTQPIQSMGQNGDWVEVTNPDDLWDIKVGFAKPWDDPDFVHLEVRVDMKPASTTFNEPLDTGLLGLGIHHMAGGGAVQSLPNDPMGPPAEEQTLTWETLLFELPKTIPLQIASWNIGQMPSVIPDAGAGEPDDFARKLAGLEIACINEAWSDEDRVELVKVLNEVQESNGQAPVQAVGLPPDDQGGQTTGLLLLSARPFIQYEVREFNSDHCAGWDCEQDKGAIWGRILFEGGAPTFNDGQQPGNADHFIDVYCTHLQSGDEHASVRSQQLDALKHFIDTTRAPDRPALLMGDFNIVGSQPSSPSSEYDSLLQKLDIASLTPFDMVNSWTSSRYDLGVSPLSPGPMAPLQGTSIPGGDCTATIFDDLVGGTRLDYLFVLPAPDLWPSWAIALGPSYTIFTGFVPTISDEECLSDHAKVKAVVSLVKTELPGAWNPTRDHRMTFRTLQLTDHGSGGCCADWFTKEIRIGNSEASFTDEQTPDGDVVTPGWSVSRLMSTTDAEDLKLEVWESDWPSDDDVYDSSAHGKHARFRFDHLTGLWEESDNSATPVTAIGNFNDFPDGMTWTTQGSGPDDHATVVHALEAEEP